LWLSRLRAALAAKRSVVHTKKADGTPSILVGELVLPKDHPEVKPGDYDATFTVQVGFDKRIGGQVERLTPIGAAKVSAVK
jgi:hypothetical protein